MAIPIERFHYSFIQRANHSDSEYLRQLSVAQRDMYFNRSKNWLIIELLRYVGRTSFVDDQIRPLFKREVKMNIAQDTEEYLEVEYPVDVIRRLRNTAVMEHVDDCCDPERVEVKVLTSDKIDSALKSAFRAPSYKWRETIAMRSAKGLLVYHAKDGRVTDVFIDYVRNIADVAGPKFAGGEKYINEEGKAISSNVDFELESPWIFERVIDAAVIHALTDAGYIQNAQAQLAELVALPQLAIK